MMDTVSQPFALAITIIETQPATATIQLGSNSYQFSAAQGERLDPFFDPAGEFVMDNIVCTNPGLPGFRAYYRPDQNSQREEWVFEYGDPWLTPPSASMGAYTASIKRRDGTTQTVSVPAHYWFSRWRWQSAVRRVRRTASQLWNLDLIPHFDVTGLAKGGIMNVAAYTPMSYCGLPSDQGQTGGYPGLGIQTGWQTQYLVRGAPESSFRNQAEAAGTFQAHVRDTHTHAPIDIVTDYPTATMYSANNGSPFIPKGPSANRTDQGHMPSVTYVPWLLTGDPYYLEGMQFWTNQNMLALPGNGSRFMVAGRYLAWPLRAIYECVLGTPDSVPSWLLPRSYWVHWLDVCRGFIETRAANNADPFLYVFHTVQEAGQSTTLDPTPSGDHVWQQGMLDLVAAWIACTRDEWVDPAEWLIRSSIDRASADSGWCRARPSPYHLRMQAAGALAADLSASAMSLRLQYADLFQPGEVLNVGHATSPSEVITLGSSSDGVNWTINKRGTTAKNFTANTYVFGHKYTSWQEATTGNNKVYGWTNTTDNDHLAPDTADLTYPSYQRAALAQAMHAGLEVPRLTDAYGWLDAEMRRLVTQKNLPVGDNWCVMPALTGRRRRRGSDRTDLSLHPELAELIDELRGVDV